LCAGCAARVQVPELAPGPAAQSGAEGRAPFRTPVSHVVPEQAAQQPAQESILYVPDPLERMNRAIYEFNANFDAAVFLPLVRGYEFALPQGVRDGVSNAIDNLNEVPTLLNCLLQGKLRKSGVTLGRFVMNSTLGVAGFLDPASDMGIARQEEDFGQTLGVWGMGKGPYVVLPVYGPSNARDTLGTAVDMVFSYYEMEMIYDAADAGDRNPLRQANTVIRAVDKRARMPFRYHSTGTPFEYDFLRFLYSKKRDLDVEK
jgi:phospholipid-binding lipoprotein MlaA